ncbi:6073_t:CDS:10 [Funneliformis mosseae]|uniref:6073_t:CDS:1 n=1 Tax=Funneliformis mosseae TaxID=27381 RepID=A0A9N9FFR2_FUNMO|nr:6073_t:CDS:10 [Funneliformis mosseae]
MLISEMFISKINFQALLLNFLRNTSEITDKHILKLNSCHFYDEGILALPLHLFTVLSCRHIYHQIYLEKHIIQSETRFSLCPISSCILSIELVNEKLILASDEYHMSSRESSKISCKQDKIQGLLQELSISAKGESEEENDSEEGGGSISQNLTRLYKKASLAEKCVMKEWFPNIYLPSVKILRRNNVNTIESQYYQEFQNAITIYDSVRAIPRVPHRCLWEQRRTFYKERQFLEQERNINIIQENVEFILGKCRTKIKNSCLDSIMIAYTEVIHHLQQLDLLSIRPEVPIASGVIDLSGSKDLFTNLLLRIKQILTHYTFHNERIPEQINIMIDDFIKTYKDLRPDFDLVFIRPIAFPQEEIPVESKRILMTVFDLLEELCRIWSCRPLLTEDEYSENAYVIHAVSKVLDPIFTYSKWLLKRAWSEQMSKSSQSRMERMKATNSGKKPDLQVLLKLNIAESELVLAKFSRLLPQLDKEIIDWKKVVCICKDCFDERYNIFFNGRDDTSDTARLINIKLGKLVIPLCISSCQTVEIFLKNALEMKSVVEKIIAMTVDIKDEINLLRKIKDRTLLLSMMSTTYSLPRNY